LSSSQPYTLTIEPELNDELLEAAREAVRPIIMPWIRDKLDQWIAEGRLVVEEREDGRWWKYSGSE